MVYQYTQTNKLNAPEYYMYSRYYGTMFLEEYFEDRDRFLTIIIKQISRETAIGLEKLYKDFKEPIIAIKSLVSELQSELTYNDYQDLDTLHSLWEKREFIYTENALFLLLEILLENSNPCPLKLYDLLNYFLRRYEIKKYILDIYFSKTKHVKRNCLFLYALSALCFILYSKFSERLNFLNTSIKLNDLLCTMNSESDLRTRKISRFSIFLEREEILKIMKSEGIS